jgi:outer membrane protein assembly factor BamB
MVMNSYNDYRSDVKDGPMDSPWPMLSYDVRHTGRSPLSTADNLGAELWRVPGEEAGVVWSSPVIDNNGTIYFGTLGDGSLYALNPDGTKKWRYRSYGTALVWSTPALAEDGTIYFGTWGSYPYFRALYENGTVKWLFATGPANSPTIADDGTIYVGADNSLVWALNPNGTQKWTFDTGGIVMGCPAIGPDGFIYIGSEDHYLYALYPNGTMKWRYDTGSTIKGSASLAGDGTIYVPSFNSYFYALSPNGTLKWKGYTGNSIAAAGVALAEDGTIYVGTEQLRAFNPDGTLKWTTNVQGSIYGTVPAVSADGTIYMSAGGSLVAVNPDGSEKWRKQLTIAQIHSSPCIGPDHRVYVGSEDYGAMAYGYLHAFGLGPLRAEAGGPYSGLASHTPVRFTASPSADSHHIPISGSSETGTPQTSWNPVISTGTSAPTMSPSQSPTTKANSSSDTTTATITYGPPTVWYIKPIHALYIANIKILPLLGPRYYAIVIGRITVKADASHPLLDIDRIEFYVDSVLQSTDRTPPYTWTWDTRYFQIRTHTLGIKAYTTNGTEAVFGTSIYKFL